jgi:cysteine desulfurase
MIYLDHNATTTIRPDVITLMNSIMNETGNGSATHAAGRRASLHIETARERIATAINTRPAQVIFTGCATESINTILKTFKGQRILATSNEHAAVLDCGQAELETTPVDHFGLVDMDALEKKLQTKPQIALVSIIHVNNETGVIQPIKPIADLVHKYGALLHVDAVQALGKIPVDFMDSSADYMCLSAHKFGGPQGVGAFVFAAQKPVKPLLRGGKQEKRQRAGTSNIAGIAGMGLAAEIAVKNMEHSIKIADLRDEMEKELSLNIESLTINGDGTPRVYNTSSITVPNITNTVQLMNLDLEGVCVSSGSACSSGVAKPSHALTAMGLSDEEALSTIRISLGWDTTKEDIALFVKKYIKIIERLRP